MRKCYKEIQRSMTVHVVQFKNYLDLQISEVDRIFINLGGPIQFSHINFSNCTRNITTAVTDIIR